MSSQGPPEQRARVVIDGQLAASGWLVCDRAGMDLVNHAGVAVREVHLGEAGRADYLLYVERRLCGVIEAKPAGTALKGVEWQTARYADGVPAGMRLGAVLAGDRLPFLFEASGSETAFTNVFDPEPASRRVFAFPRPETLARFVRDAEANPDAATWRGKVADMSARAAVATKLTAEEPSDSNLNELNAALVGSRKALEDATAACFS